MTPVVWILDERGLHDACGIGSQAKRGLHAVYDLGFR
jgi:hypothetical protein